MEGSVFFTVGLPLSLFIIMTGMGMSLTAGDFKRVVEQPRGVTLGTLVQLVIVPALGFAVGYLAGGGMVAVGLVLVAALPGGTTSNVFSYLARANLALSITLTVIASLAIILTLPMYVNWALELFVGQGAELHLSVLKTLIMLLVIVVLPVGIGMLVRRANPGMAERLEPLVGKLSMLVLIAVIIAIVVTERNNIGGWLAAVWWPVLLLNIASLGAGFLVGKAGGLPTADTLTLAIETGIKNTTLALTIAISLLKSAELALPAAIYGIFMFATAALIASYGRRVARQEGRD